MGMSDAKLRIYFTVCGNNVPQIRPSAPSSVISRPTCFSGSLRCCWQVGSAPFVWRRCDCLASSAPFRNIQTYLLTYKGSVERVTKLVLLHAVPGPGMSWKTPQKLLENNPGCSV